MGADFSGDGNCGCTIYNTGQKQGITQIQFYICLHAETNVSPAKRMETNIFLSSAKHVCTRRLSPRGKCVCTLIWMHLYIPMQGATNLGPAYIIDFLALLCYRLICWSPQHTLGFELEIPQASSFAECWCVQTGQLLDVGSNPTVGALFWRWKMVVVAEEEGPCAHLWP